MIDFLKLQNGSDIRGVAMEGVPGEDMNLSPEAASAIISAFVDWLADRRDKSPRSNSDGFEQMPGIGEKEQMFAAEECKLKICVGMDSRLSGPELKAAALSAIEYKDAAGFDAGLATTPAMFMSTVMPGFDMDGAVMITASHLPYNRNGFKFFTAGGGLDKEDIKDILDRAAGYYEDDNAYSAYQEGEEEKIVQDKSAEKSTEKRGLIKVDPDSDCLISNNHAFASVNLMEAYASYLRSLITNGLGEDVNPASNRENATDGAKEARREGRSDIEIKSSREIETRCGGKDKGEVDADCKKNGGRGCLSGLHIIVDAGNGAAGFFATEVLAPLGADISGSLYLAPDGNFPNHAPNPEDKKAIGEICDAVRESGADLGIIFDTDGDRSAAVAPGGTPIARNEIVAIAAALAACEHPAGTVVTDSITSNELTAFLESKLGLRHFRYKRGYRNVIRKAMELCGKDEDAFLAIETSGHAAYSDNYFLDDGAYLAVRIVISAAKLKAKDKDIGHLIKDLKAPTESTEIRYKIKRDDFGEYAQKILSDMEEWAVKTKGLEIVKPNYEGVRINFKLEGKNGWFLLRRSLHDPVMPLNIESSDEGGVAVALDLILDFMHNYEGIEMP